MGHRHPRLKYGPLWVAAIVSVVASGCASGSYGVGRESDYYVSPRLTELTTPQTERGKPVPVLDTVGWIIGIPDKIILWDRRVANHDISVETETAIDEYLAVNELSTVKVRLNQYAPLEDWKRLRANDAVGAGWRYTFGSLSLLGEAILPGRVFGYDHFNPYSNTVHLFSDAPAIALHEAGHAKDFARRNYKGTYAAVYLIPGVALWHEAIATDDALEYLESTGNVDGEAEAYRLLYPAYGTYAGDAAGYLAPELGLFLYAGGVLTGHAAGRWQASRLESRTDNSESR